MKKRTRAQLEKIAAAGYAARREIDEMDNAVLNKRNAKFLGTCQKYHNSYGSGDRWWLYRRILSIDGEWCKSFNFQTDCNGQVEIEVKVHGSIGDSWQPITEEEYRDAWLGVQEHIAAGYALDGCSVGKTEERS